MSRALHSSIRRKLMTIILLTTACALVMASVGYVLVDLAAFRAARASDLTTLATAIGYNAAASLLFGDSQSAKEVLQALRAKPSIVAAAIYTKKGKIFAVYGASATIPAVMREGVVFASQKTEIFQSIRLDGEVVGTIYIAVDRRDENAQTLHNSEIALGILLASLFIAFIVSARLQRGISQPIVELARVAGVVSREKNFSVRAADPDLLRSDEIGNLITGFNTMLAEIEQRDCKLLLHQTHLEETVALRTVELTAANEELLVAKNAAEQIAETNARLARESALILNTVNDGIFGVDLDTEPTFVNPAAVRMLGRSLSDFKTQSVHALIHHSRADGTRLPETGCPLGEALLRGETYAVADDTFWRADGTSFPVEYSATPMFDEEGKKLGAVVMFRDVTERRAIERLKSEFVSTVSHELRTPLTSIRGALGLLSSGMLGSVQEKGQRMLQIAVTNTDRLVRLINDILDLERIESGTVELQRATVDANAVMVQALEGVQSMADDASVRLEILPGTGMLWGDSDRIIQTLTNLLGNAIKFSPRDTTVLLSGIAREADFLFCVADQGRGVPEQKLETIFERFSQVNGSDSRDKGGSGLGLAICRSIVNAHGGRIWAENNDPAGSRFQFTIPLQASSPVETSAIEALALSTIRDRDEPRTQSILVVEDDLDLARVMITALQARGIRTFHAATGAGAIALCRQEKPSLIVLDVTLPDMDGYAVVTSLRESASLRQTALLVYSALDVGSADQARLQLGPTEFLTKSRCSLADFEKHVIGLLGAVAKRESGEQNAA